MIRARTVSQGTVRTRPAAKSRDLLSSSPAHAAATSSSGSSRLTNNSSATRTRSWRGRRRTSASNSSVDTGTKCTTGIRLERPHAPGRAPGSLPVVRGRRCSTPARAGGRIAGAPPEAPIPFPPGPDFGIEWFVDRAEATNRDQTGFGTAGLDFDHDGRLDVLVAGRRGAPLFHDCRRRQRCGIGLGGVMRTPRNTGPGPPRSAGCPPCSAKARASCRQVKARSMYAFISSSKLASFVNTVTTARWRADRFSARIASWTSSLVGGSGHPQQPPQMIPRTVREWGPVASGSACGVQSGQHLGWCVLVAEPIERRQHEARHEIAMRVVSVGKVPATAGRAVAVAGPEHLQGRRDRSPSTRLSTPSGTTPRHRSASSRTGSPGTSPRTRRRSPMRRLSCPMNR